MLVGSQVSLKYDLDLSLTQVPENLIFYSDEQMTTAFLKENGAIHLDGTFLANDNNKTASKTIYWAWPIETGSTQTEIDDNDELDSNWIGSDVILGIAATGKQIMGNPDEEYTVTLDLNGGTLAEHGDSAMLTKQVTYGEAYGNLPVPTREGYSFEGWNGKNKINIDNAVNDCLIDNGDGTYTMWYNDKGRMSYSLNVSISKNKKLIMSYDLIEYNGTSNPLQIWCKPGNDYITTRNAIKTLANDNSQLVIYQEGSQPKGTYTKFKNLQLEEGLTVTPYEPYYVTSATTVTKAKNHTLTAIWEPVSNP